MHKPLASNVEHPELVALYDEGILDYTRRACPKHQLVHISNLTVQQRLGSNSCGVTP